MSSIYANATRPYLLLKRSVTRQTTLNSCTAYIIYALMCDFLPYEWPLGTQKYNLPSSSGSEI